MLMILMGIQPLDFVSSTGDRIKGNQMFTAFKHPATTGYRTQKFFVKDGIEIPAKIEEKIDVTFDMHGKVESIKKAN